MNLEPINAEPMNAELQAITRGLKAASTVAIVPHIHADGDALGSSLAIMFALRHIGVQATIYAPSPVAPFLSFLPGADTVMSASDALEWVKANTDRGVNMFDALLVVDVASVSRLGDCAALLTYALESYVVDHHATNDGFATRNFIDKDAAATGELIYTLIMSLGVRLDATIATCLYASLSTDTGHFSQRNTTPNALRVAAVCLEAGIDGAGLAERLHKRRTFAKTKLCAKAIESMRLTCGGLAAVMCLSADDYHATQTSESDTEAIIDFGIAVEGVVVAMLAYERGDGIKVSMRAKLPVDVALIASKFGGGGHTLAAGCTLHVPLDDAISLVETEIARHVDGGR